MQFTEIQLLTAILGRLEYLLWLGCVGLGAFLLSFLFRRGPLE